MGDGRIEKLTMPKWGLSMTHGTVVAWLVEEGAEVAVGTEVAEVESDKILSAVECSVAGVLRRHVAKVGDEVPVAGLLGVIADDHVSAEQIDAFVDAVRNRPTAEAAPVDEPGIETVEVDGHTIAFLKRGEGADPIVLIHGFGGSLNNWMFNHQALAAARPVYALDLLGHGASSKGVGDGTIEALADAVGGFLNALGLSQVHLVGHSIGGGVALAVALSRPHCARSVTLIAGAGLGPEINHEYLTGFIRASRRAHLKPLVQQLFADPSLVTRQLVEDLLKAKRIDGANEALEAIGKRFVIDGRQAVDYRDRLGTLAAPLLVVWGAEDRIIPVTHARALEDRAQIEIIDDCGHMVPLEAASEVNRLINHFAA